MGWIHLAQDRDQWRALVNTIMNLQVLYSVGKFSSSWVAGDYSWRTLLHGISYTNRWQTWQLILKYWSTLKWTQYDSIQCLGMTEYDVTISAESPYSSVLQRSIADCNVRAEMRRTEPNQSPSEIPATWNEWQFLEQLCDNTRSSFLMARNPAINILREMSWTNG
jgi:hypothetical protein